MMYLKHVFSVEGTSAKDGVMESKLSNNRLDRSFDTLGASVLLDFDSILT